jgi:hypothetical protein
VRCVGAGRRFVLVGNLAGFIEEQIMTVYTLSTTCSCEYHYDSDPLASNDECFGCYDDDKDNLVNALNTWIGALELSHIEVQGSNMGWTYAKGSATIDADAEELIKVLKINGDFRLEVDLPEGDDLAEFDFKVMRYSHDEPVGASFYISGLTTCPDTECSGECNSNFCEAYAD